MLVEYSALRQEMATRIGLAYTVLSLGIAAFGAGISIMSKQRSVSIALALLTCLLWILWLDLINRNLRIGAYIALKLHPPLVGCDNNTPNWGIFWRRIDRRGIIGEEALFGVSKRGLKKPLVGGSDTHFISLFFGAEPIILAVDIRNLDFANKSDRRG